VLEYLNTALEAVILASLEIGPLDEACEEDVELCLHIGNAVEDLNAAIQKIAPEARELKNEL